MCCPADGNRRGAGVGRHATLPVDHRDLPAGALLVGFHQPIECLRRAHALAHQGQPARPVPGIDKRLRGNGADTGLGPRHDGPDGEPVRLHRHAHLAGGRVARDDGVGVDERVGEARAREGCEAQQGSGDQVRCASCRRRYHRQAAGPQVTQQARGPRPSREGRRQVRQRSRSAHARSRGRRGAA